MYTIRDLYDLDHTLAKDYLLQFNYPWEALDGIKNMILELGPTLDPEEIAAILPQIDTLVSWAEDVKAYALQQALSGQRYPGFKLVEGRSNRKYTDEVAVATVVSNAGYDPYEKKLLGITAMTKQLGKKKFDELLSGLIIKPQGKPVLAPESDKRPEFNTAQNDFMEE